MVFDKRIENFLRDVKNPKEIVGFLDSLAFNNNRLLIQKLDSILTDSKGNDGVCAYQFKDSEPAYRCKDCQTDHTCIQCVPCFKKSDHTGHDISMIITNAGGCCDCGDPESWRPEGYCCDHKGFVFNQKSTDLFGPKETVSAKNTIDSVINILTDLFMVKNNVYLKIPLKQRLGENSSIPLDGIICFDEDADFKEVFFKSDRFPEVTPENPSKEFILFTHNDESVTYQKASSAFSAIVPPGESVISYVNMVDQNEFCMVYAGDLTTCETIAHIFLYYGLKTTVLKAPDKWLALSEEIVLGLFKWLKKICTLGDGFRRMTFGALMTPLTPLQQLKMSPFSSFEMKEMENKNWEEDNSMLLNIIKRAKYEELCKIAHSSDYWDKKVTDRKLRKLGIYKYQSFYFIRCLNPEPVFMWIKIEPGVIKVSKQMPNSFKSIPLDASEATYNSIVDEKRKGTAISRLNSWIKYYFVLSGSKKLHRYYNDITLKLMTDPEFKEFWGKEFVSLYKGLVLKFNRFRNGEFSVLELGVQLFTVKNISNNLIKYHRLIERLCDTGLEITKEEGALYGHNSQTYFSKISTILHNLFLVLNEKSLKWIFCTEMGFPALKSLCSFLKSFSGIQCTQKICHQHVVFEEVNWQIVFFVEKEIISITNKICDEMSEILPDLIEGKIETSRSFKEIFRWLFDQIPINKDDLVNRECQEKNNVNFILPFNRFLSSLFIVIMRSERIELKELREEIKFSSSCNHFFDQCMKTLIKAQQIDSRMWIYNGISVLNQSLNYQSNFKTFMLDKDVAAQQIMICLYGVKRFFTKFFKQCGLSRWIEDPTYVRTEMEETSNKKFYEYKGKIIDLIGRFFGCRISAGRYTKNERIRYELVQNLLRSPMSYSKVLKSVENVYNRYTDKGLAEILKTISTVSSSDANAAKYSIRDELKGEFDYFFDGYKKISVPKTPLFEQPFPMMKQFNALYGVFSQGTVLRLISKILNCREFLLGEERPWIQPCITFVYLGLREVKSGRMPQKVAGKFLQKLATRYDYVRGDKKAKECSFRKTSEYKKLRESSGPPPKPNKNEIYCIIECICRTNKRLPDKLTQWILLTASEHSHEIENIVLEYYKALDHLKEDQKSRKNEIAAKRRRAENARKTARAFVEKKQVEFCTENGLLLKGKRIEIEEEKICIFCKSNLENQPLSMLINVYRTNSLLFGNFDYKMRREIVQFRLEKLFLTYLRNLTGVNHCSHLMHRKCFEDFENTMATQNVTMDDFLCPFCSTIGNSLITLIEEKKGETNGWERFKRIDLGSDLSKSLRDAISTITNCLENFDFSEVSPKETDLNRPKNCRLYQGDLCELITVKEGYYSSLKLNQRIKTTKKEHFFFQQIVRNCLFNTKPFDNFGKYYRQLSCAFFSWGSLGSAFRIDLDFDKIDKSIRTVYQSLESSGDENKSNSFWKKKIEIFGETHSKKDFWEKLPMELLGTDPFQILVECLCAICYLKEIDRSRYDKCFAVALNLCWLVEVVQIATRLEETNLRSSTEFLKEQNRQSLIPPVDEREFVREITQERNKKELSEMPEIMIPKNVESLTKQFQSIVTAKYRTLAVNASMRFLRRVVILMRALGLAEENSLNEWSNQSRLLSIANLPSFKQLFENDFNMKLIDNWFSGVSHEKKIRIQPLLGSVQPDFIKLPTDYSELFELSRSAKCTLCEALPRLQALCLLCGSVVCALSVCDNKGIDGMERHLQQTHPDEALVFLSLKWNLIFLVRSQKTVLYPSPYVNEHGETDREMIEGKPLKLNETRFEKLRQILFNGTIYSEIKRGRIVSSIGFIEEIE